MIRDRIEDKEHFVDYIERQKKRITRFQESLDNNEVAERRIISVRRKMHQIQFHILIAEYSMGVPVSELVPKYEKIVAELPEFWEDYSDYYDMLWLLSIGIMLEAKDENFDVLHQLMRRRIEGNHLFNEEGMDDYLLYFLLSYRKKGIDYKDMKIKVREPYPALFDIINYDNKEDAEKDLKKYLKSKWYRGHDDTYWYDYHKCEGNIYFGYWSFESGALVKILGLNDEKLKSEKYYPYDLVHYRE